MNTKNIAGISLAVMGAGFAATLALPDSIWTELAKGGFEAGLVGGFADWFAVTALFRHPMGIPIPHTSLLLRNRDKIVNALVSAMENELLNKESISAKLKKLQLLRLAATGATRLLARRDVRIALLDYTQKLIARTEPERLVPHIRPILASFVRQAELREPLARAADAVIDGRYDERAFDYLLNEAQNWVRKPGTQYLLGRLALDKLNEAQVGGFLGFAVQAFAGFMNEDKLGGLLQHMIVTALEDLGKDDNVYRHSIVMEIRERMHALADNEELHARWKAWAENAVAGETFERFAVGRLNEAKEWLIGWTEAEKRNGGKAVFRAYRALRRFIDRDPAMIEAWESNLRDYATRLVEQNHYRIGRLVKENVDRMDDKTLVAMLERKVGKDLQWIRVNGALCGFVIGLALTALQIAW